MTSPRATNMSNLTGKRLKCLLKYPNQNIKTRHLNSVTKHTYNTLSSLKKVILLILYAVFFLIFNIFIKFMV